MNCMKVAVKYATTLGGWLTLFSSICLFSSGSYANDSKADNLEEVNPYDFYQGKELSTPDRNSPFYWLELPSEAYMGSAYPDTLQDVRVFNGTGNEIPTALFFDTNKSIATTNVNFNFQRLVTRPDNVNSSDNTQFDSQYLLVETEPGKTNRIELPNLQRKEKTTYQAYLLTRDQLKEAGVLSNLNLGWDQSNRDWQAKVFVYFSTDKKNWVNIAANQPVMSLKLDSGVVASNTIELLREESTGPVAPYLMLVTVSTPENEIPLLQSVTGIQYVMNSFHRQESFLFEVTNDGITREQVIYRLPAPQPLNEISIKLQQSNRVVPLKIEYIANSDEEWKPLADVMVFNQINEGDNASNPNLIIHNMQIKGLRITALKGSWDELPPTIYGLRDAVNLVVNIQGASPYLLVWGNKQATPDNVNYTQLIGKHESVEAVMENFPEITTTGKVLELGGVEKKVQDNPVEEGVNWMTITLWVLLVVGILALLYFCWYLLKEVGASNKRNSDEL
ncbi:DUF3999 family protein [Providencia alcalifaciens]|uniref:DUF3999 family protein n=1 Tax=Providencia alcalifaciens TaxID=126385 RepID=UPI001E291E83|nr:DUF3999 family protein [Providencia alcalifaciens]